MATNIDDLFKHAGVNTSKRTTAQISHNPADYYGVSFKATSVDNDEAGPALPDDMGVDVDAIAPDDKNDDSASEDSGDDDEGRFFGSGMSIQTREALSYVESTNVSNTADKAVKSDNQTWTRQLYHRLEKCIRENEAKRAKYSDDPTLFLESEANLDDELRALPVLAERPACYDEFARLGGVACVVNLLAHENPDIAIRAVEVLKEWLDDEVAATPLQWDSLVDAAVQADIISLCTANLFRLNEASGDEGDINGVTLTLQLIEALCSRANLAARLGRDTNLLTWLIQRIQRKYDHEITGSIAFNRQYAAEVLAILCQVSSVIVYRCADVTDVNGLDTILQLLAPYRFSDPRSLDSVESEYMENLWSVCATLVASVPGKLALLHAEGIELLILMLRDARSVRVRFRALRVLDHALTGFGDVNLALATRFVTVGGLPFLFAHFTRYTRNVEPVAQLDKLNREATEAASTAAVVDDPLAREKRANVEAVEHILGILIALFRQLPHDYCDTKDTLTAMHQGEPSPRLRLLVKCVESDHLFVRRLLALQRIFAQRIHTIDTQATLNLSPTLQTISHRENLATLRRLNAGLYALRMCHEICAWLRIEDDTVAELITHVLNLQGQTWLTCIGESLRAKADEITAGLLTDETPDSCITDSPHHPDSLAQDLMDNRAERDLLETLIDTLDG